MSVDMNQFHSVFFEESIEHLQTMEELLLNISTDAPDPEDLNSIFRAAHSIKGGSGIFGFDALAGLTHVMETILDKARNNELNLTTDIVDTLLTTTDTLRLIVDCYQNNNEINEQQIAQGKALLEAILTPSDNRIMSLDSASNIEEDGFGFFDEPSSASTESADDSDIEGFGFFDEPTTPAPIESIEHNNDNGFGFFSEPSPVEPMDDSEAFGFFNEEVPPPPAVAAAEAKKTVSPLPRKQSKKADTGSIRVDTAKIDNVVNLVGEMVITQSILSMIGQEIEGSSGEKLNATLEELARNILEIQEATMSMRMVNVSFIFNRFPRLVRDLAKTLNKKIDLVIEGGDTEIDKSMIEKLADPLTHLVRNSLDHGIEPIEKRLAAGKPEVGLVTLRAEQRGGSIVISIQDDGGGLSRDKILSKAMANGMAVDESMPDEAVWQLIFAPGFSTADAVTDVSGRGVGMDVVRKNIEAINGTIDIRSTAGQGSIFTIKLPLTLAIIDGLCVSVADETYIIPLLNIVESLQPDSGQIKTVANDSMLWSRDIYWPLVSLHEQMCISGAPKPLTESIIVLVEVGNKRYGIIVDQLLGKQQVVIKSLERHYRKVAGISGATIMGDGKVAMILDVDSLAKTEQLSQAG